MKFCQNRSYFRASFTALLLGTLFCASFSRAAEPLVALGPKLLNTVASLVLDQNYQIGEEWGKVAVTQDSLQRETEAFRMASFRTAKVGGGTGFFLGQFNGQFVMATNHHVIEDSRACNGTRVTFDFLSVQTRCKRLLGSWTDVDLSLFVVELSAKDASKLLPVAKNFAFNKIPIFNEELMTFGYGIGDNPSRKQVVNQDSDCRVFSATNNLRFMADPDAFNPGPYKAWSFSNGCDVSHGDSGSAMVDRASGEIVGIIWTGKIPKDARVRSEAYLRDIQANQKEDVWTELSYAAPASKMKEVLQSYLDGSNIEPEDRATLSALLL